MRVFISQPMNGLTHEQVNKRHRELVERARSVYPNCDIVNQEAYYGAFFNEEDVRHEPVWYLGRAIQLMSTADVVLFAEGWERARGCRIENKIALYYGIEHMYE